MKRLFRTLLGDFHEALIVLFTLQKHINFIIFLKIKTFYCQINELKTRCIG